MNDMTDIQAEPAAALDPVCGFVLGLRAGDIPAQVRERAALLLLDTIGVCAASAPMRAGVLGRQAALRLYGATDPAFSARMLFDGREVSVAGAVFAAATQTDNLDAHDGFNPVKGHIGVVTVPTLAALAQHDDGLSGPDALAHLIVGYEVAGRAGQALHATVADYHTSGAWNALGVAAMAARMRGHDAATLREGLGIAEYHGPRSQMMREIATPTMLHDGSGWGALAGMTAAIMAEEGFTGAPAITVEGRRAATFWADLGQVWQTPSQYVKPYPICRWAHAAIDAAREVQTAHDFAHTDIAEITVRSFRNATALYPHMPATTSQAQYSLPFAVATMLVHGRIGLAQIEGAGLSDPEVAALVARTRMVASDEHEALFPAHRSADVTITLKDGREFHSGLTHARGGAERPFGRDDIVTKFHDLAGPVLGAERAQAIADAALALTGETSRFADLNRLLTDPV